MSQSSSPTATARKRQNGHVTITPARRLEPVSIPDAAIAKRAYEKFEARGRADGFANEDWLAAERELITEALARND